MFVQGTNCSIVIKTELAMFPSEIDVPYSGETLREAVSILKEEVSIEGDGVCRGLRKINGVKGCIITPLTIGTAPMLLYLAMGACGVPLFVSETRNLFKYELNLLLTEDTEHFDLIQERAKERILYEGCQVKMFELRILREEAVKLKLEICGECAPRVIPYKDTFERENGGCDRQDLIYQTV